MRNLVLSFLMCLGLLLNSCHDSSNLSQTKFRLVESISNHKLPIVTIDVNGKRLDFLVDTDAELSLMDSTACAIRKFEIVELKQSKELITFSQTFKKNKVVVVMEEDFYVHNLQSLVKDVEHHSCIKIDGIIGRDILLNTKSKINIPEQLIIKENSKWMSKHN